MGYVLYQRLKGQKNGRLPASTVTEEEVAVTATDTGYEIDESKLGGEVSQDLLDILVCPDDKQELEYVDGKWLVCHTCGRQYPIVDGIPVMLIDVGDKYRDESLITAAPAAG
ncbi:MAG: Trm112 family protein [Chloroflexi bacterium]|nr:MAG: Trm112 family protein [Chloroflexota bacterium]